MSKDTGEQKNNSRRQFLKGTMTGAVSGLAVGAVARPLPALAESAPSAALPEKWDIEVDVLVVGAGNGGCSAFSKAATDGANTLMIEISSVHGGSSLISGASLHTRNMGTWEEYNKGTFGRHHQVLGKVFVETFWQTYIPWLKEHDVAMEQPVPGDKGFGTYKMGRKIDPENQPSEANAKLGAQSHKDYFDSLLKIGTDAGGKVQYRTRALRLYTDDAHKVVGLEASVWTKSPLEPDQQLINIKAKKIILCTGNFYANSGLLTKYVSPFADNVRMYGLNPYQYGDGLIMAMNIGAKATGAFSNWSGGDQAVYPPTDRIACNPDKYEEFITTADPSTWIQTLQDERPALPFASSSITVNLDGKRFTGGVLFQNLGVAFRIADQAAVDADKTVPDKIKAIEAKGQPVYKADTIEELATLLSQRVQMNKLGLINTIEAYNKACDEKTTEKLDPPLVAPTPPATYWKISTPPFYAVEIASTMYFQMGGLAINENAQVLDAANLPIANLYAAPPCAGGVMRGYYTGGIACAGTFGYIAATHAAAAVKGS